MIKEDIHAQGELLSSVPQCPPVGGAGGREGLLLLLRNTGSLNLWREIDIDMEIEHLMEKQTNKNNKTYNLFGEL